jgi:hypothetical protein
MRFDALLSTARELNGRGTSSNIWIKHAGIGKVVYLWTGEVGRFDLGPTSSIIGQAHEIL